MFPTPSQIRAARALLALTQEEAAERAGVSPRTWTDVEKGAASQTVVERVTIVLQEAGVDFVAGRGGRRRGVRLRD